MPILSAADLGMTPKEFEQELARQRAGKMERVRARIAALTPEQKARDLERRQEALAEDEADAAGQETPAAMTDTQDRTVSGTPAL